MNDKIFMQGFWSESFTLNETEETKKISLTTAVFKEHTNVFSSELQ